MENQELYSLGGVIDNLKPGQMAVSTSPVDEGAVVMYDNNDWLIIKYANQDKFKYDFNIASVEGIKEKRWLISERSEEYKTIEIEEKFQRRENIFSSITHTITFVEEK